MANTEEVFQETRQRMNKTIDSMKRDFARIRTGRASPSLLDGLTVEYYGSPMPVNQVATISIPEARLMIIQPWEKSMLSPIEKAIQTSELGLNPQNDGNLLRVPIPALNEERRRDLCRNCKKICEDNKVAIRNVRRDSNEKLKKSEKDKDLTQDDVKKGLDRIQKLTDDYIKQVDDLLAAKEKEIMEG